MKKAFPFILTLLFCLNAIAQTISLEEFADGFSSPIDIQNAGDQRLFIVEQRGVIKILNQDGTTNSTPFLDIQSQVNGGGERGLLGLAFHREYATNGFFYVHYSTNSGDTQISRFTVDSANPDIANAGSELMILDVDQPFSNHNGGSIAFGPDGFLYIGLGDGGGGGDTDNNAQNLTLLLGKLVRIDIDNPSGGENYGIPADNPYIANTGARDEIWASGLRNPFRFSIDESTNTIWIGDVGQNAVEEVNKASLTEAGLNYGWRCYEGSSPFNTGGCPSMGDLTFPVTEYPWNGGGSVVGGYVYRGSMYQDLQDVYIFADIDGMIATLDNANNFINQGNFPGFWVGFGQDINKELYIADISGTISRIKGGVLHVEDNTVLNASIFPNPAKNRVTVALENETIDTINISDIKGSILYSETLNTSQKEINTTTFAKGIYFIAITTKSGTSVVKKLMVQ